MFINKKGFVHYKIITFTILSFNFISSLYSQDSNLDNNKSYNSNIINEKTDKVKIQYQNIPVNYVLIDYEKLTGKKIIRDRAIDRYTVSMIVGKELSKEEAAQFIEKSLLMNGFALVPSGEEEMKILAFNKGKHPQGEGLEVYYEGMILPEGDQIINYIMIFDYLDSKEAAQTLQSITRSRAYGSFIPVPNAPIMVITETSSVIKSLLKIKKHIDVPPEQTEQKVFQLEMADSENVVKILDNLLDLKSNSQRRRVNSTTRRNNFPVNSRNINVALTGNVQSSSYAPKPKLHAITRTNKVLAIARPIDILNIEEIIKELDAPSGKKNFLKRTLKYMSVLDFLPIAQDSLLRGSKTESTDNRNNSRNLNNRNQRRNNTINNNSTGATVSLGSPEELGGPQSMVVGKTLLIADPDDNELIVSGPPESLRVVNELLNEIDERPKQIYISTVIGHLTLGDNMNTGLDLFRSTEIFEKNGDLYKGAGIMRNRTNDGSSILDINNLRTIGDNFPVVSGLTIYGQIGQHLNSYLSLLESTNRFKILSRPTVFTLNNKKAIISTGERIAVPTSTLTSVQNGGAITSNIEFQDVVLRLEVIPLINSNDEVTLQIAQTNDNITGNQVIGGNEIPTIGTQQMITTVMVPNKTTILLGGLISESESITRTGVPGLIKVPILKHLFSSKNKSKTRKELLIFIQPQIVDGPNDLIKEGSINASRTDIFIETEDFANPPDQNYFNKYPPIKTKENFREIYDKKRKEYIKRNSNRYNKKGALKMLFNKNKK